MLEILSLNGAAAAGEEMKAYRRMLFAAAVVATVMHPSAAVAQAAARVDPAQWYRESDDSKLFGAALSDLLSSEAAVRKDAADYLAALLRQLIEDGVDDPSCLRLRYYDYGPPPFQIDDAEERLESLVGQLAMRPRGSEALPLARLLLHESWMYSPSGDDLDFARQGLKLLSSIEADEAKEIVSGLLEPPHADRAIVLGALDIARSRKLVSLRSQVLGLTQDHRSDVRARAAIVASELGAREIAPYDPVEALRLLEGQLLAIAALVAAEIPEDAKWIRVKVPEVQKLYADFEMDFWADEEPSRELSGWRLSESDTQLRMLDSTGIEKAIDKTGITVTPRTLRDEIGIDAPGLSAPAGVLPGIWAWQRGEVQTAVELLMPTIYAQPDLRPLRRQLADRLGHATQEKILDALFRRDFATAKRLGRLLGSPAFDGYWFQSCAAELAEQLDRSPPRSETISEGEWQDFAARHDRKQQIDRLVELLTTATCVVDDPAVPDEHGFSASEQLRALNLTVSDIPVLARHLLDDSFIPGCPAAQSGWRRPGDRPGSPRRVRDRIASDIGAIAKQDIVRLREFDKLDRAAQRERIAEIGAWAREHSELSETDRYLQILAEWTDRSARVTAMKILEKAKDPRVIPYLIRQATEEPQRAALQLQSLYGFDTPDAVPLARASIAALPAEAEQDGRMGNAYNDWQTRIYAGLILLRHGDRAKLEGLEEIRKVLEAASYDNYFAIVWDELASLGRPEVNTLLHSALERGDFCERIDECALTLCRMIVGGNRAALTLLQNILREDIPNYVLESSAHFEGRGPKLASAIARWKGSPARLDWLGPGAVKAVEREDMSAWVAEQFELLSAGKPSDLGAESCRSEHAPVLKTLPPVP